MKKKLSLLALIVVLGFIVLHSLSAGNDIPSGLANLLSGKNTDTQNVLSTLDEKDIPLALAACEVLQHKALHQDIKLSPEAVEAFKSSLQKRIETSQTVSFKETPTCIQKIPAREFIIEGKHLTVPEHYLAPVKFAISGFSPTGEAGTLLPDIRVSYTGGKAPVTAKIFLDGKEISAKSSKSSFLYRPKLQADSILKIGSHKGEAVLSDASNVVASASWSFTVGVEPSACPTIPADAALIGSLTTPITTLVPGSSMKGDVGIFVYETPDGQRLLEYRLGDGSGEGNLRIKTTSLFFLQRFMSNGKHRESVNIFPKTRYVFAEDTTRLSYVYSGDGKVIKNSWRAQEPQGSESGSFETSAISWQVKKWSVFTLTLTVQFTPASGTPYTATLETNKDLKALGISSRNWYWRYSVFAESENGPAKLDGDRNLKDLYSTVSKALVEGESFPFPAGSAGRVKVVRSRWKIVGGPAEATIENKTAVRTNLLFSTFGFVELIHDVAVTYDWEDEHYEKEFLPKESYLYGRFPYKASVEFKQFPTGIIFNTTRNITFKTIDLELNGEKRHITNQAKWYCPIDPPITLAKSSLFPESKPIVLDAMIPVVIRKTVKNYEQLPYPTDFRIPITFDKSVELINNEIPCRAYFQVGNVGSLKNRPDWDEFFEFARPLTSWLSMKGYSTPAELVQVEFEPQNPETEEGKKVDFKTTIVPKSGLGIGKITADGGTLNLLDGYETQSISGFDWSAFLPPNQNPVAQGSTMNFSFEPKNGTGTYAIHATTLLKAKEKDSGNIVDITGVGSTTVLVTPGFKIISPIASFSYPIGVTVAVNTSLPPSEWSKISWFLNDKPWNTEVTEPPARLQLEKSGKTTLKAVYKPSANVEQTDEIAVFVKPVSLKITPARKVIPFVQAKTTLNLNLHVELNGNEVHELGKEVAWDANGQKASVEKIEWSAVTKPKMEDPITYDEKDPFTAVTTFAQEGALTALATVTIKVTNPAKDKKQTTLTFSVSAGRADLWAIPAPSNYDLKGHFPQLALAEADRTFIATEARFIISNNSYIWIPSGLTPKMVLSPALPGVPDLISQTLNFNWKASDGESSMENSFIVSFKEPGNNTVTLETSIDFGDPGAIPIIKGNFPLEVASLAKFIVSRIDPASFTVSIGKTQALKYEIQPSKAKDDEILICKNAFKVQVKNVDWLKEASVIGHGNPFKFVAQEEASGIIVGKSNLFFQETFDPPARGGFAEMTGETKFSVEKPITKIIIRRVTPTVSDSGYQEVSFRKEKNRFRAIAFFGNEEIGPIPVNWTIEGGLATTTLQLDILKVQGVSTGQIAMINGLDVGTPKEEVTLTSFLPGNFSLSVEGMGHSASTQIRVKQPTLWLSIKAVDGVASLSQLSSWISETKNIWLQENNFLNVKIRHGEKEDENFPWVENASFSPKPWPSCSESSFASKTNGLWLLEPLVFDPYLNIQNNDKPIVPRLTDELLLRKRSVVLSNDGSEKDLNVFITKQAWVVAPLQLPVGFTPYGGYTISQDECFYPPGVQKIIDSKSSGIVLSHNAKLSLGRYSQDLAHEIGHFLIQIGLYDSAMTGIATPTTDEHVDDQSNLMISGTQHGRTITASQALMIMDYKRQKPETSYFVVEE